MSDPWIGGLIGGVAGLGSSAINAWSTAATNAQNEALMREAWAREDTAVQRRARDLKKAGLNPVLAAGSAASSQGPIKLEHPEYGNILSGAVEGAQAGVSVAQTQAQVNLVAAQARKTEAEATMIEAETPYADHMAFRKMILQEQLVDIKANEIQVAEYENVLAQYKKQHVTEFVDLELKAKKLNYDKERLAYEEKQLLIKLLELDIKYYGAKAISGIVGSAVGSFGRIGSLLK